MTTHHFEPATHYNTFGPHPPALRLKSGDRVATRLLDAWGADAEGKPQAGRPNPLSGPFHVEGAEPGDALAVHLERLAPARDDGFSKSHLAPNVVEPARAQSLPEPRLLGWRIDRAAGTARLDDPPAGLEGLVLPLQPMIGCLGVAPPLGQAISTATCGPHGGNMDYRGFRQGVTALFPVFVPGALFALGDGHALQGEGEVCGTGVETAFEVEFSLEVIKGRPIHWPRGEDATHLFTIGNARPLEQALQHATSEMAAWLEAEHGIGPQAVGTLLGMCAQYEIGSVYNPAYTIACRLEKRRL